MERQRSGDLFPTDRPLPASQMIGRDADVRGIVTMLEGGANVVVAGVRRTGKTSVCDAALLRAQRHGLYTVGVDLFRIPTAAQLAETLVARRSETAHRSSDSCTRPAEPAVSRARSPSGR